jgi:hypothetical protein
MSKINNITAYEPTTPTATTILIGSEDSGGATRNYLVSALATYMSSNITTLTDLTLSGFLTVGGATTLADTTVDGTLGVTGATTLSSTLDVTGNTTIGGQLLVSGLLQVGSFTMTGVPIFFNGINAGGTSSLADTTVSGLPKLTGLSTFADNASALGGGLVANDVYKTATGELRIVV